MHFLALSKFQIFISDLKINETPFNAISEILQLELKSFSILVQGCPSIFQDFRVSKMHIDVFSQR